MIAEWSLIVSGLAFEFAEAHVVRRQFMQAAPSQVGLPTQQLVEPHQFSGIFQRRTVAAVELRHLLQSEIGKRKACAHVERGLVHVGDKQVGFSGVSYRKGEVLPRSAWVKRALVVPGTKQPENLAAEIAGEQRVNIEIQLVGDGFGQGEKEVVYGVQMCCIQLL